MQPLIDTPLVAAPSYLNQSAVMGGTCQWSWRQVHAASVVLACQLEGVGTLCNLCGSRVGFLITWLAALRRGCLQLLPPSGGHADLVEILKSSETPLLVVDDIALLQAHWTEHARCLVYVPEQETTLVSDAALSWTPQWDAPLLRLYTSGSTGVPEPQAKSLRQLACGAHVLGARLEQEVAGGLLALRRIVCSVPSQHMFGVETSVMLSLIHGIPVHDCRPLLPADVNAAFAQDAEGAGWIATPLHLRALVQSGMTVPHCRVVVASTMPLAQDVAVQAEALVAAPVLEIYGSTETGVVAMRRSARDRHWHPVLGVRIQPTSTGARVWGRHFSSPQLLADQIDLDAQGHFQLLGRRGDMIKIAGRRASLAGLNLLLQDLPGLSDGVLYMPDTGVPTERLVLIYAGSALGRAATESWLRQRMDPVFMPRAMICVERLPRTENGKLPRAALDQIYASWLAQRKA